MASVTRINKFSRDASARAPVIFPGSENAMKMSKSFRNLIAFDKYSGLSGVPGKASQPFEVHASRGKEISFVLTTLDFHNSSFVTKILTSQQLGDFQTSLTDF